MERSENEVCQSSVVGSCDTTQCMMHCSWCYLKNKATFARFHDIFLQPGETLSIAENMNHVLFLIEGALSIRLKEVHHNINKGHMVFFSRIEKPQITVSEASFVIVLAFNNRVVFGGVDCLASLALKPHHPVPGFVCLDIRPTVECLLGLLRKTLRRNEESRCFHALKEYELFMYLWEEYSEEERIALFHTVAHPRDDLQAFMVDNYNPSLCGEDYANLICVSKSTFNRLFCKTFGMPFYKWQMKRKEDDLRNALLMGIRDSKELAQRLGFKNVLSLYRFCRNHFGCSLLSLADELKSGSQSIGHTDGK